MVVLTRRALTASSFALLVSSCASPPASRPTGARADGGALRVRALEALAVELSNRDLSVKPGDDFNRYCNGHWFATTQIPPTAPAGVPAPSCRTK